MNNNELDQDQSEQPKQPDEKSGVLVEARIKIFDPESDEVYLEGRV